MAATEWLLIGGPADGKKVTILHGSTVRWAGHIGKDWIYQGHDYFHCGRIFRIGVVNANDANTRNVAQMIDESGLHPIGEADVTPNAQLQGPGGSLPGPA